MQANYLKWEVLSCNYNSIIIGAHTMFCKECGMILEPVLFRGENGFRNAGNYSITFSASELPSGICFYKIESDQFFRAKK
jgi:hypothetical protein